MRFPAEYYDKAHSIMDKRKADNLAEYSRRYNEVTEKSQTIENILTALSRTSSLLVKIITSTEEDKKAAVLKLRDDNLLLQDDLAKELKNNGFPEDYLDDIYTCKLCYDTGISADGTYCTCFNDILKDIASKELNKSIPINNFSFEKFDLQVYKDEKIKASMTKIFDFCKAYADSFSLENNSICMWGGTGLGKTHLSLSIARKVIEKGYFVIYGSVPDLIFKIQNENFGRDKDGDTLSALKECDLLILDDLGTENKSEYNSSLIYQIINSRINTRKPTIISTNLSVSGLTDRYTERVVSRLSTMNILAFKGNDYRQL